MMNPIAQYLVMCAVWTLAVWTLFAVGSRLVDTKAWSGYWLAAILVSLVPLLVGLLPMPQGLPAIEFSPLAGTALWQDSGTVARGASSTGATGLDVRTILVSIWLTGAAFGVARVAISYHSLRRCAAAARPVPGRSENVDVRLSGANVSPYALGFFRPVIVLPESFEERFERGAADLVVAHEAEHLRRRDPEVVLLLTLIRRALWFAPWFGNLVERWKLSAELSADHVALIGRQPHARRAYANVLIETMRGEASLAKSTATFGSAAARDAKSRLRTIIDNKEKPMYRTSIRMGLAALSIGLVAIGSIASSDARSQMGAALAFFDGTVTASFGQKDSKGHEHGGVDLAAPAGTNIHSPARGLVVEATGLYNNQPAWGNVLVIQTADETRTIFAHLESYSVQVGQRIDAGDLIGTVGSSGVAKRPHVHIETTRRGKRIDPAGSIPRLRPERPGICSPRMMIMLHTMSVFAAGTVMASPSTDFGS